MLLAVDVGGSRTTAPVVVATGGPAPLAADRCRSVGEHEPDLTVHGLRLAFERQQADRSAPARRGGCP